MSTCLATASVTQNSGGHGVRRARRQRPDVYVPAALSIVRVTPRRSERLLATPMRPSGVLMVHLVAVSIPPLPLVVAHRRARGRELSRLVCAHAAGTGCGSRRVARRGPTSRAGLVAETGLSVEGEPAASGLVVYLRDRTADSDGERRERNNRDRSDMSVHVGPPGISVEAVTRSDGCCRRCTTCGIDAAMEVLQRDAPR